MWWRLLEPVGKSIRGGSIHFIATEGLHFLTHEVDYDEVNHAMTNHHHRNNNNNNNNNNNDASSTAPQENNTTPPAQTIQFLTNDASRITI